MSYADAPTPMQLVATNASARLPRIAAALAVATVLVLQLAWPPVFSGPARIDEATRVPGAQYPLRVALPDATALPSEELASLIEEHEAASGEVTMAPPSNGRRFAAAFGSGAFGDDRQLPKLAPPVNLKPGEFMPLDYDIGTLKPAKEKLDRGDGSLTVSKPLLVDGVSAGSASIRIEDGANILISTAAVAKALGPKADALPTRITRALASGNGYIPFYELRSAGIAVEYDPVRDRVSMSMPS